MERLPELKRLRASSLSPELYGEISEFFSSVHPDFAISGRTSLYVLYDYLQKAKRKKLPAKKMKKAEGMIRALCAAADIPRELRARELAGGAEKEGKKGGFAGKKPEQLTLTLYVGKEMELKFGQLGITDRKAMERVLAFIGEEEFSKRHAKVVEALPEKAYKPFFSKIPDFLSGGDFYPALMLLHEKVRIIDGAFGGGKPKELDYERDPNVLFRSFREIAERTGLDEYIGKKIRRWGSERPERAVDPYRKLDFSGFRNPKMIRQMLEGLGYYVTPITPDVNACIRRGASGEAESILLLHGTMAYEIPALRILFWQAGVTPKMLRAAGVRE